MKKSSNSICNDSRTGNSHHDQIVFAEGNWLQHLPWTGSSSPITTQDLGTVMHRLLYWVFRLTLSHIVFLWHGGYHFSFSKAMCQNNVQKNQSKTDWESPSGASAGASKMVENFRTKKPQGGLRLRPRSRSERPVHKSMEILRPNGLKPSDHTFSSHQDFSLNLPNTEILMPKPKRMIQKLSAFHSVELLQQTTNISKSIWRQRAWWNLQVLVQAHRTTWTTCPPNPIRCVASTMSMCEYEPHASPNPIIA